jgi:NADH dehydrogenase
MLPPQRERSLVTQETHVVIIGGGFGGLRAARDLRRAPVRVTLIDRSNHHLFQPLLYQVATAALNPSDIAAPIRSILRRQANATVLLATATAIDAAHQRVILSDGELSYDYLIVGTGASHSYFGHEEWAPFAPGLKTIADALDIRRRILVAFENAEREEDPVRRAEWLTFVVVGAGATGVELAGALAEIARFTMARDFRHFDPRATRVVLVEGLPRILQTYPAHLSSKGHAQLEKLGVEVMTGTRVTEIDERGLQLGDIRLTARTILWAAGVRASPLLATLGVPLDNAGRVLANDDLTIPGHTNVFVIGDAAAVRWRDGIVPGVAQGAIQGGRQAARNIRHALRGEACEPFVYRDKGSMATIGRAAAIAQIGRLELSGLPAWLAWLVVHIVTLIGFRNRAVVLLQWAWAYLRNERGARLIT